MAIMAWVLTGQAYSCHVHVQHLKLSAVLNSLAACSGSAAISCMQAIDNL